MPHPMLTPDSIELMIIRHTEKNNQEIDKIYIKKSDFNELCQEFLNANPYFNGIKWLAGSIITTFFLAIIIGAFSFFSSYANK